VISEYPPPELKEVAPHFIPSNIPWIHYSMVGWTWSEMIASFVGMVEGVDGRWGIMSSVALQTLLDSVQTRNRYYRFYVCQSST